jgi:hypothetical protein
MEFMVVIQMYVTIRQACNACSNQDDMLSYRTRINWYLATVNSQLVYYTGEQQLADNLTDGTPLSEVGTLNTLTD